VGLDEPAVSCVTSPIVPRFFFTVLTVGSSPNAWYRQFLRVCGYGVSSASSRMNNKARKLTRSYFLSINKFSSVGSRLREERKLDALEQPVRLRVQSLDVDRSIVVLQVEVALRERDGDGGGGRSGGGEEG
jgi:hypothetical protein